MIAIRRPEPPPVKPFSPASRERLMKDAALAVISYDSLPPVEQAITDDDDLQAFAKDVARGSLMWERTVAEAELRADALIVELSKFVRIDNGTCTACQGHWLYRNGKIDFFTGEHRDGCAVDAIRAALDPKVTLLLP